MNEHETQRRPQFPANWQIASDFDPNDHLMQLKGRDYLNVQARLLWFIRDQRALIVAGLSQMPYVLRTELVEHDRERQYAHFKTYVRDVLGNEATMYGSETGKDFADYAEKASTKSLGRALLALGYGTAFAPEMDEGDRVVDTPQRHVPSTRERQAAVMREVPAREPAASAGVQREPTPVRPVASAEAGGETMATEKQVASIRKLCEALGKPEPDAATLTYNRARELLTQLSGEYQRSRRAS
ncbi:MAG TPA: hypothetical protein VF116_21515 [Ktedonobacterales bacterium]